ncbi:30S ribosomal protein S8 [Patescibacteria group bacterium]
MNDKVSELIISIKNAGSVGKEFAVVPYSKLKFEIANILRKEGYIGSVNKKGKKVKKVLEIGLVYGKDGKHKVNDVKRISKLSKRVYLGFKDIKPVRYGQGALILSTPKGILTDKKARKEKVGGEALFEIF